MGEGEEITSLRAECEAIQSIESPPRNQRFRSSRKGWTFCAFSLLLPYRLTPPINFNSPFTIHTTFCLTKNLHIKNLNKNLQTCKKLLF